MTRGTRSAHGGGHWDVQSPRGGYRNVYPGGSKPRGGKPPVSSYSNISIKEEGFFKNEKD